MLAAVFYRSKFYNSTWKKEFSKNMHFSWWASHFHEKTLFSGIEEKSILVVSSERVNSTPNELFEKLICSKLSLNTFLESCIVLEDLGKNFYTVLARPLMNFLKKLFCSKLSLNAFLESIIALEDLGKHFWHHVNTFTAEGFCKNAKFCIVKIEIF